mgnify:CR=1 FL=1
MFVPSYWLRTAAINSDAMARRLLRVTSVDLPSILADTGTINLTLGSPPGALSAFVKMNRALRTLDLETLLAEHARREVAHLCAVTLGGADDACKQLG